jgi:nucleoside-diphosphate-sugar epimerase
VRAVVLGATGFLGRALANRLEAAAYDVDRVGSAQLDLCADGAADALARRLGRDAILVVCSALNPPAGATLEGLRANVSMVLSVAAALEAAEVAACVYLSSAGVYGPSDDPVTERTPVQPTGCYPIAKYTGEMILQTVCARRAIALLVLRPVAVFGPGDTHDAYGPNRFARTAREEGRIVLFGGGEELRDHLHVDDFADYATSLIEQRSTGVFNVAGGMARTFADVAEAIRDAAAAEVRIEHAARTAAVTHRTFDTAALRDVAAEVRQTDFAAALAALLAGAPATPRSL